MSPPCADFFCHYAAYNLVSKPSPYRNLNPYGNYDDGYEAIYYDGEYDPDRYDCDPEYAEGVDDAMDELDEDG